jgi:hypothetical protein
MELRTRLHHWHILLINTLASEWTPTWVGPGPKFRQALRERLRCEVPEPRLLKRPNGEPIDRAAVHAQLCRLQQEREQRLAAEARLKKGVADQEIVSFLVGALDEQTGEPPHFTITPVALMALADRLTEESDPRLPGVQELLAIPAEKLLRIHPGETRLIAQSQWWTITGNHDGSLRCLCWSVSPQTEWGQVALRVLPRHGVELATGPRAWRHALETVRIYLVAALLGRSMRELEIRQALLGDEERAALALLLPHIPWDARAALREQAMPRFCRLRDRAGELLLCPDLAARLTAAFRFANRPDYPR